MTPPAPITGSAMKAATVSGPSSLDQLPRARSAQARGELLLALAGRAEAVVVRAVGMQDAGDRQIEVAMVVRQAGQAGGGHGDAVIALDAAR